MPQTWPWRAYMDIVIVGRVVGRSLKSALHSARVTIDASVRIGTHQRAFGNLFLYFLICRRTRLSNNVFDAFLLASLARMVADFHGLEAVPSTRIRSIFSIRSSSLISIGVF